MRMQNTDMEFVTFDAQDILTSSVATSMAVQINLIRDYNDGRSVSDQLFNQSGTLFGGLDPAQPQNQEKGTNWLFFAGGQSDTDPRYYEGDVKTLLRAAEGGSTLPDERPDADVIATQVSQIVDWLTHNRGLQ